MTKVDWGCNTVNTCLDNSRLWGPLFYIAFLTNKYYDRLVMSATRIRIGDGLAIQFLSFYTYPSYPLSLLFSPQSLEVHKTITMLCTESCLYLLVMASLMVWL